MKTKIKAILTTIVILAAAICTVMFSYFVVICLLGVMVCLGIYVIYMAALQHWDYKEEHGKKKLK
jgi:hypothetical protein